MQSPIVVRPLRYRPFVPFKCNVYQLQVDLDQLAIGRIQSVSRKGKPRVEGGGFGRWDLEKGPLTPRQNWTGSKRKRKGWVTIDSDLFGRFLDRWHRTTFRRLSTFYASLFISSYFLDVPWIYAYICWQTYRGYNCPRILLLNFICSSKSTSSRWISSFFFPWRSPERTWNLSGHSGNPRMLFLRNFFFKVQQTSRKSRSRKICKYPFLLEPKVIFRPGWLVYRFPATRTATNRE